MKYSLDFYKKQGFYNIAIYVGDNLLSRKLIQAHIVNVWGILWRSGAKEITWDFGVDTAYITVDYAHSKKIAMGYGSPECNSRILTVEEYFKEFGEIKEEY